MHLWESNLKLLVSAVLRVTENISRIFRYFLRSINEKVNSKQRKSFKYKADLPLQPQVPLRNSHCELAEPLPNSAVSQTRGILLVCSDRRRYNALINLAFVGRPLLTGLSADSRGQRGSGALRGGGSSRGRPTCKARPALFMRPHEGFLCHRRCEKKPLNISAETPYNRIRVSRFSYRRSFGLMRAG